MREEIKILWIDDTKDWIDTTKKLLNRYLDKNNVAVRWDIESDCDSIYGKILNQTRGFSGYDIFLIDYKLSIRDDNGHEVCGNDLIRILRNSDIQVDILFYSSQHEDNIRKIISNNFGDYEGVYVSGRGSFNDKVLKLITKNARKAYSLSNIRGFLTNETSENDFIINSILYSCFDELNSTEQEDILKLLRECIRSNLSKIDKQKNDLSLLLDEYDNTISKNKSLLNNSDKKRINFKKIFINHSSIITQEIKYKVFVSMISIVANDIAKELDFTLYKNKVVSMRNTLAHKKLDLCRKQMYINYADHIEQYQERLCPENCINHSDKFKISLENWEELKKETLTSSKVFDKLYKTLISERIEFNNKD